METKTDILIELASISPLIAAMNKVNVFTVPQGYFDSISATLLACLQEEKGIFNPAENKQWPDVPVGYFDQLATSIVDKIKATETAAEEIRNLSPLLYGIQGKNVFEVPSGYFESVNKAITGKINTVIAKEELKELSPLLHGIQNKALCEAPDEYFTHLPDTILKMIPPRLAKIAAMRKRSFLIKYAVAATMAGVMALGIYKYLDKPGQHLSVDASMVILDAAIEKGKNMNDRQFNETLGKLTETDIAKYLEKNGDFTDVATLKNNLEDSNLPSQEDYLMNEKTLENYLRKIEKTTPNN